MIISRLEIPATCSDLIYVGVVEHESRRVLVVYNISYMLTNKIWRNITIRQIHQTLVPPNFRRLRYMFHLRFPPSRTTAIAATTYVFHW